MKLFLVPALFCGLLTIVLVQSCPSKFKNSGEDDYMNATKYCLGKLNLKPEDLPMSEELNRNADLDDKCMSKCLLEKFEVVTSDGFDRDVFYTFLEENAPKQLLAKLTEVVNKCADSTEIEKAEKSKDGGPTAMSAIPCQTHHAFLVCFTLNAEKLC